MRLAELAKKSISVPASTACVEGMFSIVGHTFSLRRRRLGIQVLMDFVWVLKTQWSILLNCLKIDLKEKISKFGKKVLFLKIN